jgi:threonine/homoserine/homoserine lactone efflux protein
MISFLNPKILVFLVAVFSQFIDPQMTDADRVTMAVIAGIIDTTWYVLVAAVLSGTTVIDKLRENSTLIDRMIGVVLLVLAMGLIVKSII